MCSEYKIHNADIEMRGDHDVDDLVDVIEGQRVYVPCLYVLNKIDQITLEELDVIDRMDNYVPICAYHEWNLDGVLEAIWDKLSLMRCASFCARWQGVSSWSPGDWPGARLNVGRAPAGPAERLAASKHQQRILNTGLYGPQFGMVPCAPSNLHGAMRQRSSSRSVRAWSRVRVLVACAAASAVLAVLTSECVAAVAAHTTAKYSQWNSDWPWGGLPPRTLLSYNPWVTVSMTLWGLTVSMTPPALQNLSHAQATNGTVFCWKCLVVTTLAAACIVDCIAVCMQKPGPTRYARRKVQHVPVLTES